MATRDLSVISVEVEVLAKVETKVDDAISILSAAREAREHRQQILQRVSQFGGVMGLPEPVMRDLRDCADRGAGYRWGSLLLTERDVQALVASRERTEVAGTSADAATTASASHSSTA